MTTYANVGHVLLKRGNTVQSSGYTGPLGELTINTDTKEILVQDNTTRGGFATLASQSYVTAAIGNISAAGDKIWVTRAASNTKASTTQAVAYDSQGNVIALLNQNYWIEGDDRRATIVKLDSNSGQLWSVDLDNGIEVNPWSLVCDADDNVYAIVQRYTGALYNNTVVKLSGATGAIIWQVDIIQNANDSNNMQAVPMVHAGFDGVVIAGTAYNVNNRDFFIAYINKDGTTTIPASTWGDQWDQRAYSFAVNNTTGDILLVGVKESNNDNAYYLEMAKFNIGTGIVWQKSVTVDGNYDVQGTDVCLLPDGNWAIVATHVINTNNNGNYGVITMKVADTDGSVAWSRELSAGCGNVSSSIAVDSLGNIYISASTFSGFSPVDGFPIFNKIIGAYDAAGTIVWQKYFRSTTESWLVDNNWWNQIGSTGKTVSVYGNRLLLGALLAPGNSNNGPTNSYGLVAQLTTLGEDETIGTFETRNSYLTDSAVSLTVADTTFNFTENSITLANSTSITSTVGTLLFVVDWPGQPNNSLVNGLYYIDLDADGTTTFADNKIKQKVHNNLIVETSSGGSIKFIRNNGYLSTTNPINFGTGSWSVEAWINLRDNAINSLVGVGTTPGLNIYFSGTTFAVQSEYGVQNVWTNVVPTLNTWHHIAVGFNGEGINAWLDGQQLTGGQQGTVAVGANYGNNILSIGAMPWSSTYGSAMYLTNLRIIANATAYDPNSSTITIPIGPLTNSFGGTQLLLLTSTSASAYVDSSGYNNTINNNSTYWNSKAPSLTAVSTSWQFGADGQLTFPTNPNQSSLNQKQRNGMGDLIGLDDGGWTLGEFNGTAFGTRGIRINPSIEGNVDITLPADNSASTQPVRIGNFVGDVQLQSGNYASNYHTWQFGRDGSIGFPNQATNQRTGTADALLFSKNGNQKSIGTQAGTASLPTVERLVIAGGDSYFDGTNWVGEGGDLYLWAGRGNDGGDIKVDAGNSLTSSQGGTVKIRGGSSPVTGGFVEIDAGAGTVNGGPITLTAGTGNSVGGAIALYSGQGADLGGSLTIQAGAGYNGTGGDVQITSGAGPTPGQIRLTSNNKLWQFGSTGVLGLPYNNYLETTNINLAVGSQGAVAIRSNAAGGATINTWTFGVDGSITFPGNTLKTPSSLSIQTPSGIPDGVANWNGGGGWNQGSYSDLATTGGTGTGLTVDVAAGGGGYINITAITIHTPGTGYTNGDVITINNENNIPGTFTIGVPTPTWTLGTNGSTVFPDHKEVTISGNLTVGNLTVNGNSTIINTQSYTVSDNIITMADGNPADTLDLGFVAHRTVNGILQHTGLVRNASLNTWALFSNVVPSPGNTVDFTNAIYDSLVVGSITSPTITDLYANAAVQATNITTLQNQIYSNANVASYLVANPQSGTYTNSNVAGYLPSYAGNVSTGNIAMAGNISAITFSTGASITGNSTTLTRDGSIFLNPASSGTFPSVVIGGAGRIAAPNGSVHLVLNAADITAQVQIKGIATATTSTTTGSFTTTGGIGIGGNLYLGGIINVNNVAFTRATNGYNNWKGNTYANVDNVSCSVFSNGAPAFSSVSGTLNYFWSSVTTLTGGKFFGNTNTGGAVTTLPALIGTGIFLGSGGDTVTVILQDQTLQRAYEVKYMQTVTTGNCAIVIERLM